MTIKTQDVHNTNDVLNITKFRFRNKKEVRSVVGDKSPQVTNYRSLTEATAIPSNADHGDRGDRYVPAAPLLLRTSFWSMLKPVTILRLRLRACRLTWMRRLQVMVTCSVYISASSEIISVRWCCPGEGWKNCIFAKAACTASR